MVVTAGIAPALAALSTPCLYQIGLRDLFRFEKGILPPGLAPGLRPHLGLNGYKPFVLLYTTGGEMAERGGHAPHHAKCATISLAKSPGSLVRFFFQRWCP